MTDAQRAAGPGGEPVEVVAVDGTVERVTSRAEIRAGRLRHRCTFVVVVDAEDRVVVHQRAPWKDIWPGRWDLAFGGIAGVGEPWDQAARRELVEEAGVEADLVPLWAGTYDDAEASILARVYLARHDGPFTFPDGEVVASERVPVDRVVDWLLGRPHCPDSVALVGPRLGALAAPGSLPPSPPPGETPHT